MRTEKDILKHRIEQINNTLKENSLIWDKRYSYNAIDLGFKDPNKHSIKTTLKTGLSLKELDIFISGMWEMLCILEQEKRIKIEV